MKKTFLVSMILVSCTSLSLSATGQSYQKPILNHIAKYVFDLKVSAAFYTGIIGLDTIPEPFHDKKHVWLSVGPKSHLHLIEGAKEISIHDKNNHLCFSVQSVPEFIKILVKNKIDYENWPGEKMTVTTRVDGVKQIYFKDPDGYWIEVNDAKE